MQHWKNQTKSPNNQVENRKKLKVKIDTHRERRKSYRNINLLVIKRPKNVVQALELPKVLNLNPRSAMNKLDELMMELVMEKVAALEKSYKISQ